MLFRVSLHRHAVGEVISPGQFGAQYRVFRPGGPYPREPDFTSLLIEIALEAARKSVAPQAPSRLDSIFTCETFEHASIFRERYRQGQGSIFGVEPQLAGTPQFRGNLTAISTPAGPNPYVDYLSDWARDYWTTEPTEISEILVGGPVVVVTDPLHHS
ncbi:hypothetical protein YH62_15425 [Rhizobium sp. LC145]|nr:hypothetical protein YH62_15425 [Rhizobium sp. LC145]